MNEILSYLELHIGVIYVYCTIFINILCVLLLFLNKFEKKYENIIFVNIIVFIIYEYIFFEPFYGPKLSWFVMILSIYILCFLNLKILRIIIIFTYKSIKNQKYTHEAISKKIKIFVFIYSLLPLIVFTPRYIYEQELISVKDNLLLYESSSKSFLYDDKIFILSNEKISELRLVKFKSIQDKIQPIPYEEYTLSLESNAFTTNDDNTIVPNNETELRQIAEELLKKQLNTDRATDIKYQVFKNGYILVKIYGHNDNELFGSIDYTMNNAIYKDFKYIDSVELHISNIYEIN